MPTRLRPLLALLLVLSFVAGACGSDDDGEEGTTPGATTTTEATGDGPVPGVDGDTVTVLGKDISQEPGDLEVPADTELTFVYENVGQLPHNLAISSTENGDVVGKTDIKVGPITQELTLTLAAGTYKFLCEVHPGQMVGELVAV